MTKEYKFDESEIEMINDVIEEVINYMAAVGTNLKHMRVPLVERDWDKVKERYDDAFDNLDEAFDKLSELYYGEYLCWLERNEKEQQK